MIRIKIIGRGNGEPDPADGSYVEYYDVKAIYSPQYEGGLLKLTRHADLAKKFNSVVEARDYWAQVAPYPYNIRADGKPNRPLTAFTVALEPC